MTVEKDYERAENVAWQISAEFGHGEVFLDFDGWEVFEGRCIDRAQRILQQALTEGGGRRYEFKDDSAIVIHGDGWDFGFPGERMHCWCWPEANNEQHQDNCQASDT